MTDFAVTGKKRSGKGLFCAGLITDALREGRRVATNMDIFPENVLSPFHKGTLIRLPDTPTAADMEAIGKGNDVVDDSTNGIIVLDECSKFFNARQWGDKGRQPLLDWLIHSGKLGWDVYYQMQGLEQVDKQLRSTQIEYHIAVKRTDRWPIPVITPLGKLIGLDIRFPKMHIGIIKHGCDRDSMVVDRKWYKAESMFNAYDTRQVFLDRDHPDSVGMHSVLSPWHLKGRYLPEPPPVWMRRVYNLLGIDWIKRLEQQAASHSNPATVPKLKPKLPLVVQLGKLSDDEAIRHFKRLDSLGAFNDPAFVDSALSDSAA